MSTKLGSSARSRPASANALRATGACLLVLNRQWVLPLGTDVARPTTAPGSEGRQ
jgi:hypothetical protein